MKRKKGFLDVQTWKTALQTWRNRQATFTIKNFLSGTAVHFNRPGTVKLFFMGEPLLHPNLPALIQSVNKAGANAGIQTNGHLLGNHEIVRALVAAHPYSIAISIDGVDPATYNKIRSGAQYETILKNIASLADQRAAASGPAISLQISSILPDNSPATLEKTEQFLKPFSEHVDSVNLISLNRQYDPEFIDAEGNMQAYSGTGQRIECIEPFEKLNILWDGTITPCCTDIDGEIALGKVADGVDTVWQGDKMDGLRRALISDRSGGYGPCEKLCGFKP